MTPKPLVLMLALASLAVAGCGQLGDLERPGGPAGETPRTSTLAAQPAPASPAR